MKKNNILITTAALIISVFLTSCYNDIFYEIRKDVEPETATVSGVINDITRYTADDKEYLVINAEGGIYYKLKSDELHGSWLSYDNLPCEQHSYDYYHSEHNGQTIVKILADSANLYVVAASYIDDSDLGTTVVDHLSVYGKKITLNADGLTWNTSGEWTCILDDTNAEYFQLYNHNGYQYSAFSIFQSNTPMKNNRLVYFRKGRTTAYDEDCRNVTYYQIYDMKIIPVEITPSDSTAVNNISSVAVLNGKPVFFNSIAATTNETYSTPATRIYFADDEDLYYSAEDNSLDFVKGLNAGNSISTIATTKNTILLGRADYSSASSSASGGIVRTTLTDGVPGANLIDFDSNAEFQLASTYFINALVNATPDRIESESAMYASISFLGTGSSTNVSYKNIGLWSYYPARGNWNRE